MEDETTREKAIGTQDTWETNAHSKRLTQKESWARQNPKRVSSLDESSADFIFYIFWLFTVFLIVVVY